MNRTQIHISKQGFGPELNPGFAGPALFRVPPNTEP